MRLAGSNFNAWAAVMARLTTVSITLFSLIMRRERQEAEIRSLRAGSMISRSVVSVSGPEGGVRRPARRYQAPPQYYPQKVRALARQPLEMPCQCLGGRWECRRLTLAPPALMKCSTMPEGRRGFGGCVCTACWSTLEHERLLEVLSFGTLAEGCSQAQALPSLWRQIVFQRTCAAFGDAEHNS